MSNEGFAVVEATENDAEAITAFLWQAWEEAGPDAPGFAGATEETIRTSSTKESIVERVGGPRRRMFIAKEGEQVVGFSANRAVDDDLVELAGIVVLESMTGKRIGTHLCRIAIERARREDYRRMRVRTEVDNERALGFYESQGFQPIRTLTETVGDTEVVVTELVLDLTRPRR